MVSPVPAGIKPGWWADFLFALRTGRNLTESIAAANSRSGHLGKEMARIELDGQRLTIPVEGGANALKRRGANPLLSNHGKWRREHLGAWQAIYGRTPWYPNIIEAIENVYAKSESEPMHLCEFNHNLLLVALEWVDLSAIEIPERLQPAADEIATLINPELSIFDALFRLGITSNLGWGKFKAPYIS